MMNIALIRLRKPRRVSAFQCDDVQLNRDDSCIVQTDRGHEWGACLLPPEPAADNTTPSAPDFKVLRRANRADEKTLEAVHEDEIRARGVCIKNIIRRSLPMKLVDVEVTFDRRKIIFFFTAEDRVDFRELVRDLAHELRTRIELRHIQVRDEAKMVGGLGCCGRPLCCSSFLDDFKPISMRMAKRQDLSLNPTKISGQCGRLLCCLAYENDQYDGHKKKREAPAPEAEGAAPAPARTRPAPPERPQRPRPCPRQAPQPDPESLLSANLVADYDPETVVQADAVVSDAPPAEGQAGAEVKTQRRRIKRKKRPGGPSVSQGNRA